MIEQMDRFIIWRMHLEGNDDILSAALYIWSVFPFLLFMFILWMVETFKGLKSRW